VLKHRRYTVWIVAVLLQLLAATSALAAPPDCVILLHGLARTSYSMVTLQQALEDEGFVVANIDYPSRAYPIETLAPDAVNRGVDACRNHQAGSIHFVTHSMGGILVRYYLSHHVIAGLGRVVMLGPPNQGSEVVDEFSDVPGFSAINGPAGAQLGTGPDSVPNRLGAVTYPVGVIAGTESINPILSATLPAVDDGKVSVERTRVAGMADFITVDATHSFIMRNAEAIRQTLAFLQHGQFSHDASIRRPPEESAVATHRD